MNIIEASQVLNNLGTFIAGCSALFGVILWKKKIKWDRQHNIVIEAVALLAKAKGAHFEWQRYTLYPFVSLCTEGESSHIAERPVRESKALEVINSLDILLTTLYKIDSFGESSGDFSGYGTALEQMFKRYNYEINEALDNKNKYKAPTVLEFPYQVNNKFEELESKLRSLL
ncbi:hypothetical protein CJF25_11445 [Photobacterium phosphoreum]|uniref:hypothetical protein n=1 Tax=Photobacterium phosphoreum TaxID=659 RepID=UPI001E6181E8|nr:hypothetical protein [Photobacterium phosphoreum]MCD9463605.1 hypothetical protein [Photobacterium phosphoreum]